MKQEINRDLSRNVRSIDMENKSVPISHCLVLLGVLITSSDASAGTGLRRIVDVGCHQVDTTCFVALDGPSFGPSSCHSSELRWDSGSAAGRNSLSMITAAFMAGRSIDFEISGSCYPPGAPTFTYYHIR